MSAADVREIGNRSTHEYGSSMDESAGEIALSVNDDIVTVSLTGEVDMVSVDALDRDLARALEADPNGLVIDLSEATFVDSSILGVAITLARRHNVRTAIVAPTVDAVRTLLGVTAAGAIVPVCASRADALQAIASADQA